jgi:hypothetical protein
MNFRPTLAPALLFLACCPVTHGQQTASSSSSKTKRKTEQHVKVSSPASSQNQESVYRNADFGFAYRSPYAWVDRTQAMQDDASDPAKSRLLLAVFERPPEVTGDSVNSAVVITAESVASYPGLKTAADYMGPLTELTTGKGFKVTQQPYEFPVGTTTQLVRSDFSKEVGKLTMYQSSLVSMRKGFVVSFTFIGGSEDEVDELIENLSFGAAKAK